MEIKYFPEDIPVKEDWLLFQSSSDSAYKKVAVKNLAINQIIYSDSKPFNPTEGQIWVNSSLRFWQFLSGKWKSQYRNLSLSLDKQGYDVAYANFGGFQVGKYYEISPINIRAITTPPPPPTPDSFSASNQELSFYLKDFNNAILMSRNFNFDPIRVDESFDFPSGNFFQATSAHKFISFSIASSQVWLQAKLSFSYREILP
jgi:hypothetical protein